MAKKTIQIKNRFTDEFIFECEAESVKECVEEAVRRKADLSEANLRGANLWKADLWKADLRGANLWKADLRGADLRGADLSEANLRGANLWKADLSEANLRGANLWKADLSEANLWKADLNAVFYKTKVTAKQKTEIVESDLFEVVDDSTSYSTENHSPPLKQQETISVADKPSERDIASKSTMLCSGDAQVCDNCGHRNHKGMFCKFLVENDKGIKGYCGCDKPKKKPDKKGCGKKNTRGNPNEP